MRPGRAGPAPFAAHAVRPKIIERKKGEKKKRKKTCSTFSRAVTFNALTSFSYEDDEVITHLPTGKCIGPDGVPIMCNGVRITVHLPGKIQRGFEIKNIPTRVYILVSDFLIGTTRVIARNLSVKLKRHLFVLIVSRKELAN